MGWSKFHVRTLDDAGLSDAARAVAMMAQLFQPTLLIGIRSGGYVVAQRAAPHLPPATLLPITRQRPSSKHKQVSLVKRIVGKLPRFIADQLRIAEHMLLTQFRPPKPADFTPDAAELAAIVRALGQNPKANILIMDDSVDSGATLAAVADMIRKIAPHAPIKTAAITVTTDAPLVTPDFFLYRYALCRFPWSLDA